VHYNTIFFLGLSVCCVKHEVEEKVLFIVKIAFNYINYYVFREHHMMSNGLFYGSAIPCGMRIETTLC